MSMFFNFHPCLLPRSVQSRIGLGPSLDCPWFYPAGPVCHPDLGNEHKQGGRVFTGSGEKLPPAPRHPDLQRMLEAQLSRQDASSQCRLGHQQPDQVVRQQIDPKLFLTHLRRFAAEHCHAQGRLDISQIQLHLPALAIQPLQLDLGGARRMTQRDV